MSLSNRHFDVCDLLGDPSCTPPLFASAWQQHAEAVDPSVWAATTGLDFSAQRRMVAIPIIMLPDGIRG